MDVKETVEKMLGIKIESIEEIKERSFPLFDMVDVRGTKLTLIKDPVFLIIGGEEVYEKKIEGNFVVIETEDGRYLLAKYVGEPNVEALRSANSQATEEDVAEAHETEDEGTEETNQEEEKVEEEGEDNEEQGGDGGDDPVKEIVEKLPKWADGAVITKKDNEIVVLPVKRSTKKEGAYYAAVSWKPLDVSNLDENMVNHVIMKNGKTVRANVYPGDRYINIFIRSSNGPRKGGYSGRRR